MTTIKEIREGRLIEILTILVIGGLGFFLAITFSEAVGQTVDSFLPDRNNKILNAWIKFAIGVVIAIIILALVIVWFNRKNDRPTLLEHFSLS